jgi:carbamoyl-phosphate synthase small subunit
MNAVLILEDGKTFFGKGIGAYGVVSGELCFNTSMTGYQEILSDPSYSEQLIVFTFPHIGNVGANDEDIESFTPLAKGLIVRNIISMESNFRSKVNLNIWLKNNNLIGIASIDTRALTRHINKYGAQNAVICHLETGISFNFDQMIKTLRTTTKHKGLELARKASCNTNYLWQNQKKQLKNKIYFPMIPKYNIVVLDFGVKHSILAYLAEKGCRITVIPASSNFDEIMSLKPDGILLSNGPGDPVATSKYASKAIRQLIDIDIPIFGICLGFQLLTLAIDAEIEKMQCGHRGANHPVRDLRHNTICITSQNHGFMVKNTNIPRNMEVTHLSLFDNTIEGFKLKNKPVFGVQFHPEASPGPHDSLYLFDEFITSIETHKWRYIKTIEILNESNKFFIEQYRKEA